MANCLRLLIACALVCIPAASYGDVITDWNTAARNAIRANRTSPPVASRALAILHASMYDAVNGISRSHEPYLVQSAVPSSASKEAAAAAAGRRVLMTLFPREPHRFDHLYHVTLAGIPDGPHNGAGIAWGEYVAAQILAARDNDGSAAIVAPPEGSGPGAWVATPLAYGEYLLPQWAFVWPFAMPTSASFRPDGPPSLDSARYTADFNEVKTLGAAMGSTRTADQTLIALFWADGAGTETPAGHWNGIAQVVAGMSGNRLEQNARLFALLNIAMADAGICAWDAKYSYMLWRPITAVRNADDDGNPATASDPAWQSLIATPPFPEYVSGHSAFSGAAATILARFFASDEVTFSTGSDVLPGVVWQFTSFSAAARQAAESRVYGGIHFRSASEDGLAGGIGIGNWVADYFLQPKGNRSRK
jgi:hypothetical protein